MWRCLEIVSKEMKKANKFPTTFSFCTLRAVTTLRRLWGRLYFTDLWEIIYVRIFKIRYMWHQGDWKETINITRRRIPRASTALGQIYGTGLFSFRSYTSFRFLVKMQVFFLWTRNGSEKRTTTKRPVTKQYFTCQLKTVINLFFSICVANKTVCPLTL